MKGIKLVEQIRSNLEVSRFQEDRDSSIPILSSEQQQVAQNRPKIAFYTNFDFSSQA